MEPYVVSTGHRKMGGTSLDNKTVIQACSRSRVQALMDPLTDTDPTSLPSLPPPAFSILINTDPEARINVVYGTQESGPECSVSGSTLPRQAQALLTERLDEVLREIADDGTNPSTAAEHSVDN